METFVKDIKLQNGKRAIIKMRWSDKDLNYDLLKENETGDDWLFYRGEIDRSSFVSQCKRLKVTPEEVKACFKENPNDIVFELDKRGTKFTVLMREKSDSLDADDDSYIEHTYASLPIGEKSFSAKLMVDLMQEVKELCDTSNSQRAAIEKCHKDYESILKSFDDLKNRHAKSEKKLLTNFLHLLNTKKQTFSDSTLGYSKLLDDDSKSDSERRSKWRSVATSSGSKRELDFSRQQKTPPKSAEPSTSHQPLARKASMKRTPSKSLQSKMLSIISSDESDSSDMFGIIKRNGASSRSVFSGRRVTPVKPKSPTQKRESSVELKIDRQSGKMIESVSSASESDGKRSLILLDNAQKLIISSSSTIKSEKALKSSESWIEVKEATTPEEEEPRRRSGRKRETALYTNFESKKQKIVDPYSVDTIDVLNNAI